jgi:hypothetical protein
MAASRQRCKDWHAQIRHQDMSAIYRLLSSNAGASKQASLSSSAALFCPSRIHIAPKI